MAGKTDCPLSLRRKSQSEQFVPCPRTETLCHFTGLVASVRRATHPSPSRRDPESFSGRVQTGPLWNNGPLAAMATKAHFWSRVDGMAFCKSLLALRGSGAGDLPWERCAGRQPCGRGQSGATQGAEPGSVPPRFPSLTPVKTTAASKLRRRGKLAPLPVFSDVTAARGKEFTCCCNMSSLRKAFCLGVFLSAWMMTTAGKESRAPEHFARALFSRPTSVFSRGSDSHSFLESAPHK